MSSMSKASLADRFRTVFRDWAVPRQLAGEDPRGARRNPISRVRFVLDWKKRTGWAPVFVLTAPWAVLSLSMQRETM
jgi:hypothetical protein